MSIKAPIKSLSVKTGQQGFFEDFNATVSVLSLILISILIAWAALSPEQAGAVLSDIQGVLNKTFAAWYIYVVFFLGACTLLMAILPATGKLKLGQEGDKPEFSWFSWISMMFGAGVGIGMLTYATAEPIYHFVTGPEVIRGEVEGSSLENVRPALKWSFFYWGFSAWGCYALIGLALAFFSYSRGLPLTIRSSLVPLFGKSMSGWPGHIVDIAAVIATIVGIGFTIGSGVAQFASGVFNITGAEWIFADGKPTLLGQLVCLVVVMIASTLSALSGVGRGIKWLSNINMLLSFLLLAFFLFFGSSLFALTQAGAALWDYILNLPAMSLTVWRDDGTEVGAQLAQWQGDWTIFYWAWWIAFAPFVGMFLARVSKGRSIREYVFGALIVPSFVCFTWFALAGGTAIDLELSGRAAGSIINADISAQLYETINTLLSPDMARIMSGLIVILLMTYLVTSADSAVLVINTITAVGEIPRKSSLHIVMWAIILAASVAALLAAGGLDAIKTSMIIGALPFSFVMALMGISLFKALIRDGLRNREKKS